MAESAEKSAPVIKRSVAVSLRPYHQALCLASAASESTVEAAGGGGGKVQQNGRLKAPLSVALRLLICSQKRTAYNLRSMPASQPSKLQGGFPKARFSFWAETSTAVQRNLSPYKAKSKREC